MARRPYFLLRLLLPAVFLLLGCPPPAPPAETIATFGLGAYLTPGSEARFVAVLPDSIQGEARAARSLEVSLQQPGRSPELVYRGRTDDTGTAQVAFDVPNAVTDIDPSMDPTTWLSISLEAGSGNLFAQRGIIIADVNDVLLTTDKPVYQPGQMLHMRGLALNRATMQAAANQEIAFSVTDPAGNRIFNQAVQSSEFGIAAADLPLSPLAPSGNYTLEARQGEFSMRTTVEVKPYTLPRFKVEFNPARTWYLPGDVVTGTVSAAYFFGKPVAGGDVTLRGFMTDVARVEAVTVTGTTDASGVYTFTFTMPAAFVAAAEETEQQARTATLDMQVEVIDRAQHLERIEEEITVAESALLVELAPEAGNGLVTGADNLVYVDVSYPDGSPAEATLAINSDALPEPIHTTTDAAGLATITLPASAVARAAPSARFTIVATAMANPEISATRRVRLSAGPGLLLRPNAVEYTLGDTLRLEVFAPRTVDDIYISVEKNGESHAFATLPVQDGVAQGELPVDGALLGTLNVRAFAAAPEGATYAATRYVLVNPPAAALDVQADAPEYLPGGQAVVNVQVTQAGAPLPAALGVSVVDESVYALGESDPGFARTFFLLARTLQEPRFGIEGFSDLADDAESPYDAGPLNMAGPATTPGYLYSSRNVALAGYLAQQGSATMGVGVGAGAEKSVASSTWANVWAYASRLPFALPLLGLALYDGSRRRRRLLVGLFIVALATGLLVSCAAPALPAAAPAAEAPASEAAAPAGMETTATRGGVAPPRLRQFFPETLLWLPEVETDADGKAQIDLALADTITTWRMSIVASDRNGNLGSATIGLRAFQDFFVEPDLPTRLTVGDEIDLPVSIFNYQDAPQEVQLQVAPAAWFTFTAPYSATVALAANDVGVAYIPLRVVGYGEQTLRVDARSGALADAVLRPVTILPNGEAVVQTQSGTLRQAETTLDATIPAGSLPEPATVTFRLFPNAMSQVTDGLAALIQEPHGCFEQVTSTLYPAVLALETLRRSGATDPALERRAADIILSGYQQLLNYEVDNVYGGFSYWGDPPPMSDLTAWGLMEFSDMARVAWVEPALIERTANHLMAQQQPDGSWPANFLSGYYTTDTPLRSTAWVVWALADAGYTDTLPVQRGLAYMQAQVAAMQAQTNNFLTGSAGGSGDASGGSTAGQQRPGQPGPGQPDSPMPVPVLLDMDLYTIVMMANAFQSAGLDASLYLDVLARTAQPGATGANMYTGGPGEGVYWAANATAWTGADGYWADVDTSAMATYALLRDGRYDSVAQEGLAWLLSQRNPNGTVGTTQATVFMLKSLLLNTGVQRGDTTVTITRADTGEQEVIFLPEAGLSEVQEFSFAGLAPGANSFEVVVDGPQRPAYQMVTQSYRPWPQTTGKANESMRLDLEYDRTEMVVNDMVTVMATVELLTPGGANMLLVRLDIPPGFAVQRDDWEKMVDQGVISDYELDIHEVRAYLSRVVTNQPITMTYRLQARLPVRATAPGATAYDFYRPDQQDVSGPVQIIVRRSGE
jgi:hypothetical protein